MRMMVAHDGRRASGLLKRVLLTTTFSAERPMLIMIISIRYHLRLHNRHQLRCMSHTITAVGDVSHQQTVMHNVTHMREKYYSLSLDQQ